MSGAHHYLRWVDRYDCGDRYVVVNRASGEWVSTPRPYDQAMTTLRLIEGMAPAKEPDMAPDSQISIWGWTLPPGGTP